MQQSVASKQTGDRGEMLNWKVIKEYKQEKLRQRTATKMALKA